jgi:hypothetical protein
MEEARRYLPSSYSGPPPSLTSAGTGKLIRRRRQSNNYLLTYDSYVPLYNRFHRGEWITRVSGGEGALDTPGPLKGTSEASAILPPWESAVRTLAD